MREISLRGKKASGRVAFVDDEDYDLVVAYSWNVHEHKRKRVANASYAQTNIPGVKRRHIMMHQLITGWLRTDHIDGNGLNNQRYNLRQADPAQNGANRHSEIGFSSVFKGVSWYRKNGRWVAKIGVNGKQLHLGYFTDETDAAVAYDLAAREHFGEYACLNFPVMFLEMGDDE